MAQGNGSAQLPLQENESCLQNKMSVQDKLYLEISNADQEVTESGEMEMTYDTIMNLPYLDMVILETMRIFPTWEIMRLCTKDYKVPGTDFTIPRGMPIQVT